jgi:hypothetical protein
LLLNGQSSLNRQAQGTQTNHPTTAFDGRQKKRFHDGHPAGTMDERSDDKAAEGCTTLRQIHYGSLESEKLRQH